MVKWREDKNNDNLLSAHLSAIASIGLELSTILSTLPQSQDGGYTLFPLESRQTVYDLLHTQLSHIDTAIDTLQGIDHPSSIAVPVSSMADIILLDSIDKQILSLQGKNEEMDRLIDRGLKGIDDKNRITQAEDKDDNGRIVSNGISTLMEIEREAQIENLIRQIKENRQQFDIFTSELDVCRKRQQELLSTNAKQTRLISQLRMDNEQLVQHKRSADIQIDSLQSRLALFEADLNQIKASLHRR